MATLFAVFIAVFAGALGAPQTLFEDSLDWRVVGGEEAKLGQFPYQVSLRFLSSHICGGSLISKRYVVTAAHCVFGATPESRNVVTGTVTLDKGGTKYAVSKIIAHEGWNSDKLIYDIALVQLEKDVTLDANTATIPIGTDHVGGDQDVVLSGWGRTSHPGSIPNNLQFLPLKTITVEECRSRHAPPAPTVVDTQICTFTKTGEGACHGDSGGPLVGNGKLVGVVSWARPCAVGYPDVYTRVSSFIDWINENAK